MDFIDSLSFLDIADATVITFLVPTLTGFVCWVALKVSVLEVSCISRREYLLIVSFSISGTIHC